MHVDSPAAAGARLRSARQAAKLTQRDLAFEGCTAAYISRIEAGARTPSYQILREFGRRLGVSAEYLATGSAGGDANAPLFEAEVASGLGDTAHASELYEAALSLPDSAVHARAKAGLGQIAFRRGDHEVAIGYLDDPVSHDLLPAVELAAGADSLGRAYAATGRFDEALAIFERFLERARAREDVFETIRFTVLLADTLIDSGNFARAEELLSTVIVAIRDTVDPMARAGLYWSQSRLHSSQNRADIAARYAGLALATLENSEHTLHAARAFLLLAHLENDRGNHEEAMNLFQQGHASVAATGNRYDEGLFLLERARSLAGLGQLEEAASVALGAVDRFHAASPTNAGRAFALAAGVFRGLGDTQKALELYELAAEVSVAGDRHLVDSYTAMAELYEAEGRQDDALRVLKQALRTREPAPGARTAP